MAEYGSGSPLAVGKRNRKVVFERATLVANDFNEQIPVWSDYDTEWANVSYGTGQERRQAAQEQVQATATIWVPWNNKTKRLRETDRAIFDDATWDIVSAVPWGFNEGVEITVTRGAHDYGDVYDS